ncbi:KGW motif small protein [Acinetobacter gerneri]|nr:KGW motif small protein [Acinetobacter gerneri]
MIKSVKYDTIDKIALRQKGWMWFLFVVTLQLLFVFIGILFR